MSAVPRKSAYRLAGLDRTPGAHKQKIKRLLSLHKLLTRFGRSLAPARRTRARAKAPSELQTTGPGFQERVQYYQGLRRRNHGDRAVSEIGVPRGFVARSDRALPPRQAFARFTEPTNASPPPGTSGPTQPRGGTTLKGPAGQTALFTRYLTGGTPRAEILNTFTSSPSPMSRSVPGLPSASVDARRTAKSKGIAGYASMRPPAPLPTSDRFGRQSSRPPPNEVTLDASDFSTDYPSQKSGKNATTSVSDGAEPNRMATLHIDGNALGRWMVEHFARALARPTSGMTGIDPRANAPRGRVAPY